MFKKIMCSTLVLAMLLGLCGNVNDVYAKEKNQEDKKKEYIIISNDSDKINQIEEQYKDDITCNYGEYNSDEDEIVSMSLSEEDVNDIEEKDDIVVEEDVIVEACDRGAKKAIVKKHTSKKIKGLKQVYKQMIKADETKERKKKNNKDKNMSLTAPIKVAIIDSGIDDCSDVSVERRINLVPGEEELTPFFEDQTGHGTAVAGIIAGKGEDTEVVGINNDVLIYSAKVLDGSNSAPLSRVIEGIYWAIDNDVDIINMSFGINTESEALKLAVDKAVEKDILVVAAVGNTADEGVLYPAAYDGVLAVGSVDTNACHSEFSAVGEEVDIVAVGENVVTTGVLDGVMVTEGTSMAAPQVAAVASVLMEEHPEASSGLVSEVIIKSASYLGDDNSNGEGLVNLEKALEIYDEIKEEYNDVCYDINTATEAETEQETIDTFEVPDCVTGQWTGTEHKKFITNAIDKTGISLTAAEIAMVKAGCVFNDTDDYTNSKGKIKSLKGLKNTKWGDNGDWHGSKRPGYNYVTAFAYVYNVACDGIDTYDDGRFSFQSEKQYKRMKAGIKKIYENGNSNSAMAKAIRGAGRSVTKNNKNHFMLGMSLHILADTFAHATYEKTTSGEWKYIAHKTKDKNGETIEFDKDRDEILNPDDPQYVPERHAAAKRAVRKAMALYKVGDFDLLKVYDLEEGEYYNYTKYKLQGLYSRVCAYNEGKFTGTLANKLMRNSYNSAIDTAIVEGSKKVQYGTPAQKAELEKLLCNPTFYYWVYADLRSAIPYNEQELRNHYKQAGIYEGRTASPLFNPGWYMDKYEDVAEYCNGNYQKAYEHFVNYGFWEGRRGSMFFDAEFYLGSYSDLWNAFGLNYLAAATHFINNGIGEARVGSEDFDIIIYISNNSDLKNMYGTSSLINYYIHHTWQGWMENRQCTVYDE